MSPTINIPEDLHQRLGKHSSGFLNPVDVIAQMLDFYERNGDGVIAEVPPAFRLEMVYYPVNDAEHFKRLLFEHKFAYVKLSKTDGTSETHLWNAARFTKESSVENNLRSGYLRHWRAKGICKAEVSINKDDLSPDDLIDPPRIFASQPTRLEIVYFPNDAEHFKRLLLEHKFAYVKLSKIDGTSEIHLWHANRFTKESDLENNLRSGYLRGWRTKGICKAELSINKDDLR